MHRRDILRALAATLALQAVPWPLRAARPTQTREQRMRSLAAETYPRIEALYKDLHAHPELSLKEVRTAALLAGEFRAAGFQTTEQVGGHGVVGVLPLGEGPTLLLRADMDALPITEKTGLDYASQVRDTDHSGRETGVMHACGHDLHSAALAGAAHVLGAMAEEMIGNLVLVAQPAEEGYGGAQAMIADGLFKHFPTPDYCLAQHVDAGLPVGSVGFRPGPARSGNAFVRVTVRGIGGHGAAPQAAKDPILLSARIIEGLQSIVSRELAPGTPAVVTVGAIHGGDRANIIPEQVQLDLTIRFPDDATRTAILEAIRRICQGQAQAFGLPESLWPAVEIQDQAETPPVFNSHSLGKEMDRIFENEFGRSNIATLGYSLAGEDFAWYAQARPQAESFYYHIGSTPAGDIDRLLNTPDPAERGRLSLHSPYYYPALPGTLQTAIRAFCATALDLLHW